METEITMDIHGPGSFLVRSLSLSSHFFIAGSIKGSGLSLSTPAIKVRPGLTRSTDRKHPVALF